MKFNLPKVTPIENRSTPLVHIDITGHDRIDVKNGMAMESIQQFVTKRYGDGTYVRAMQWVPVREYPR